MLAVSKPHISERPSYLAITQTEMGQDRTRGMKKTNLDQSGRYQRLLKFNFYSRKISYPAPEAVRLISIYIGMDFFV